MKLHKAFSSIISFPEIKGKKETYNLFKNNVSKKDLFLTMNTPDDVDFARDITKKMEKQFLKTKIKNLKSLSRKQNKDIYSLNWISNKKIMRNKKHNLKLGETDECFNSFDYYKYNDVFKKQTKNIFNTYLTAKNYKFVNNLKRKFLKLNTNPEKILSNSKQLCFNGYISDLLQHERTKIDINEKEYQKAIKKEKSTLNKDIKKFEVFQVNQDLKFQKGEAEVQKYIKGNAIIYNIVKVNALEYHTIIYKIQQLIREIMILEEYVLFVYKVLGFDEDMSILKSLKNFRIIPHATSQLEIDKNINNIYSQSNILFNNLFDEIAEELNLDDEKIYFAIHNKEKMILQKISEKEDIKREINETEKEFKNEIVTFQNKYNTYMTEYLLFLKFYEEELEKYNLVEKKSQSSEEFLDNIFCLSEINSALFNKKYKDDNFNYDNLIYGNLIIPCLEELKMKENFVDDAIKKMENYENSDPIIFKKCLSNCKLENKKIKKKKERKIIELKEIKAKLKIIEKQEKIIIKDKYKYTYNIPSKKRIKESLSDYKIKKHK